jgi:CRISPR system Cascade subunit CasB
MKALNFRPEQVWGQLLMTWWQGLKTNTGGRAALRRAPNITAVVMLPTYQHLHQRLRAAGWPDQPWSDDRLAVAAGLLAHVRELSDKALPVSMSEGDKPAVSPLRFMRLLESSDPEVLFTGLRRALPLIGHRADVLQLTTDVVNWGDTVKKRWAYAYRWPESKSS